MTVADSSHRIRLSGGPWMVVDAGKPDGNPHGRCPLDEAWRTCLPPECAIARRFHWPAGVPAGTALRLEFSGFGPIACLIDGQPTTLRAGEGGLWMTGDISGLPSAVPGRLVRLEISRGGPAGMIGEGLLEVCLVIGGAIA